MSEGLSDGSGQASLAARTLAGVSHGDHVCCCYGSDREHQALVSRFVRDGLRSGDRVLYLADRSDEGTIRGWLGEVKIDSGRFLKSGQLQILDAADVYEPAAGFDPERQIESTRTDVRNARTDGFNGLSEVSEMGWTGGHQGRAWNDVVDYESALRQFFLEGGLKRICGYDRRLFAQERLREAADAHDREMEFNGDETCVRWGDATVTESLSQSLLRVTGDLDVAVSPYLLARMRELGDVDGDLVIDLSDLSFVDVTGCRALLQAALALTPPRRLVLQGAQNSVARVLGLCDLDSVPQLLMR